MGLSGLQDVSSSLPQIFKFSSLSLSVSHSFSFVLTVTPLSRPLTIFSVIAHEIVTRMTGMLAILTPLCLGLDLDLFAYLLHLLSATIYFLDN